MTSAGAAVVVADSPVCRTPTLASIPGSAQTSLDCTRVDHHCVAPPTRSSWAWVRMRWCFADCRPGRWRSSNASMGHARAANSTSWLPASATRRKDKAGILADIEKMFTIFPRLRERKDQLAGTMSGGEQQMLAMGRALMSQPKVLLLDEPSMGLSPIMVDKIFEVVRDVYALGVTIVLVEQNASRALAIADRGYVMESGLITMTGPGQQLLNDPKVRAAYLGE